MLWTIGKLSSIKLKEGQDISRYHYGVISDYLEVHNSKENKVIDVIQEDMVGLCIIKELEGEESSDCLRRVIGGAKIRTNLHLQLRYLQHTLHYSAR